MRWRGWVVVVASLLVLGCTSQGEYYATLEDPLAALTPNPDPLCPHWRETPPEPPPNKPGIPTSPVDTPAACAMLRREAQRIENPEMYEQAQFFLDLAREYLDGGDEEEAVTALLVGPLGQCWLNWQIRRYRDYDFMPLRGVIDGCQEGFELIDDG